MSRQRARRQAIQSNTTTTGAGSGTALFGGPFKRFVPGHTQPATTTGQRRGFPGPDQVLGHPKRDIDGDGIPNNIPAGPEGDLDGNGVPDYIDRQRDSERRNAFELLKAQFRQYGIVDETFFQYIYDLLVQGYDGATISLLLQEHKAYKERFKGNELRRARGLGVLSPGEYIAIEGAYAQILRSAGLPAGFYDDPKSDFADWIGKDVSPQEIKQRADLAVDRVNETDPHVRNALRSYYGVTDSMLAAHFLDQKRALPILQRQAAAAEIGGAAGRVGLSVARERAEGFADLGVEEREAQLAYGQIAGFLPEQQEIARRFSTNYTQADAEDELLGGMASARRKRERVNRKETDLFSGSGALGRSSLKRNTAGSY
jgi:hypothetical protein